MEGQVVEVGVVDWGTFEGRWGLLPSGSQEQEEQEEEVVQVTGNQTKIPNWELCSHSSRSPGHRLDVCDGGVYDVSCGHDASHGVCDYDYDDFHDVCDVYRDVRGAYDFHCRGDDGDDDGCGNDLGHLRRLLLLSCINKFGNIDVNLHSNLIMTMPLQNQMSSDQNQSNKKDLLRKWRFFQQLSPPYAIGLFFNRI